MKSSLKFISKNITGKYQVFTFSQLPNIEKKLEQLIDKYDIFVKVYVIQETQKVPTSLQTNLLTPIKNRHKISLICH